MTPLQFVSPREADSAEMYWMRKFGVASLLNTIKLKDARQKPWQWILRRSAWKPLSKETTVKCVKQQVHQLLHSRRHNLPLSEYLHLLTVARTVLPPTDFRNFFRKAEPKLLQRFKLQLPYSLPMKIPLLTREGKAAVHEICNTVIPALTVPDPLRVYLQSAVSIVSQKTSTVGQLLCNQQYQCGTADVIAMAGAECHCSQRDPSLPRSRGHVYIRDSTVQYPGLTDVIPDMSVWHQNMKNASLPDWRNTSSSIFAGLYNAVKPLTSFDIPGSVLSKFAGTLTDSCVDQLVDRSRNADHGVQKKPLKHAARALKKHGFRAGVYDKANHCPWIACNALAVSLWVECFLSDPRKNEVFRASTQLAAQFVLYTHLMHSAAHAFTTHIKQRTLQWKTNPMYRSDTAQRLTELRKKYSDMSRDFRSLWDKCLNPQRPLLSLSPSSFAEKYQKFDTPADVPSPTEAKHLPVPGCYDLQKFKSEVYHDQFKLREVVTHAKHPFRGANKRMGRVVSVVWSQAATALRSMEIISMNDVLPWVRTIKGKPQGYWLELDLKEMFMSIPRDAIATALEYCLEAIASKGHRRNGLLFSISKDGNRKRDCVGFKSREFYDVYTVHDVLHYVSFSLLVDCMFVGASSVFHQLTGVPQGGSLSAQLASIYCMWREARRPSPYCKALPSLRYRDNFLFLITPEWIIRVFSKTRAFRRFVHLKKRGVSMSQFARECLGEVQADPLKFQDMVTEKLICHLSAIYGLGVQFEQAGLTVHFLTSRLTTEDHDWATIAWKSSIHNAGCKSPPPLSSWLDPWAPNTPRMLMSAVPNAVKQSQHFRLNKHAVLSNLSDLVRSLNVKQYPVSWWKNPIVCCSEK